MFWWFEDDIREFLRPFVSDAQGNIVTITRYLLENSLWIPWGVVPLTIVGLLIWTFVEARRKTYNKPSSTTIDLYNKPLEIIYHKKEHFCMEVGSKWTLCSVSVKNNSDRTIKNVTLKILHVTSDNTIYEKDLDLFKGLNLAVSNTADLPYVPPESVVTFLHSEESCTFDVVRVDVVPGNHTIKHAHYVQHHIDRKTGRQMYNPSPKITIPNPTGKFKIAISAQGDDIRRTDKSFEFWGTEIDMVFQPLD